MNDLNVGDWFVVHDQGLYDMDKYYVVAKSDNIYWISTPGELNDYVEVLTKAQLENTHYEVIGTSVPNPWYKWFGWSKLIHKVKLG